MQIHVIVSSNFTATTKKTVQEKLTTAETITEVLSHYGPWGYLMLGMLICGTVLMFCGLWECCCRKPKPNPEEPTPRHPTAVLIVNQQPEAADSRPPSYEDLDQPPPYSVLFPNCKETEGRANNDQTRNAVTRENVSECVCRDSEQITVEII